MNTHSRNVAARIGSGLLLAGLLSGCQATRNGLATHPFSRMFPVNGNVTARADDSDPQTRPVASRGSGEKARGALDNADLIRLAHAGNDSHAIIAEVRKQGGHFEINEHAVADLQSHGVSEDVITAIKRIAAYSAEVELEQDADGVIQAVSIPAPAVTDDNKTRPASWFTKER